MKHIKSNQFQQEKLSDFSHLSSADKSALLKSDPESAIKSLTQTERRILNFFIRFTAYHKNIYPSHRHIGQVVKKSPRQVIRVLKVLRDWGLISWTTPELSWYRELANDYTVNPIIKDITFRRKVGYWLKGLWVLPLVLLASNLALAESRSRRDVISLTNFVLNSRAEAVAVESLCTDNSSNKKRQIRYTKVNPGLTKAERRRMSVEQLREKTKLITAVKLNAMGQVHMTPYSVDAIMFANHRIQQIPGTIKNPIAYLKKLCSDWHKEHKQPMDFEYVDTLLAENPSFRDLPVYQDDGAIHKTPVSPETAALSAGKKRIDPKEWGIDTEAQPVYQGQPKSSAPQREFHQEEGGSKRRFEDPYATKYAYLREKRNPDTFDREASFNQACDHFKAELAVGNTINPFAQIMLDLQEGKRIDGIPPYEQMAQILSSFAEKTVERPTPSHDPKIIDRDVISSEDAPFVEPGDYEDWVWQEI